MDNLEIEVNQAETDTYNKLWSKPTIESKDSLIVEDLLRTVYAVFVHQLTYHRTSLILHAVELGSICWITK